MVTPMEIATISQGHRRHVEMNKLLKINRQAHHFPQLGKIIIIQQINAYDLHVYEAYSL